MRGRNSENIHSLCVHHRTLFAGGITHVCGGLLLWLPLGTTFEVLECSSSLWTAVSVDPRVAFVCSTLFLIFFPCTNIIDSGEPKPASPALLLYFFCVPLSGFLFSPPRLSLSLSLSSPLTAGLPCINAEPESGCQTESCFVSSLAPVPWWGPTVCDNGSKWKQKEGMMRGENDRFVFPYTCGPMCIHGHLHKQLWLTSFPADIYV